MAIPNQLIDIHVCALPLDRFNYQIDLREFIDVVYVSGLMSWFCLKKTIQKYGNRKKYGCLLVQKWHITNFEEKLGREKER